MNKIFFITGVNGVGKSAIIPHLKTALSENKFAIFDFDARGVPENAGKNWRISETKHWMSVGKRISDEGKSTIICGFIKLSDFEDYDLIHHAPPEIVPILLSAKPEIIRQRLINRYTKNGIFDKSQKVIGKPIDEFINGNAWLAERIEIEFKEHNFPIIDTSGLTPAEVAKKSAEIISAKIYFYGQ